MNYEERDLQAAIQDRRIWRSLVAATRDAAIRRMHDEYRAEGFTVQASVRALSEHFALSEERIRSIVYEK